MQEQLTKIKQELRLIKDKIRKLNNKGERKRLLIDAPKLRIIVVEIDRTKFQ